MFLRNPELESFHKAIPLRDFPLKGEFLSNGDFLKGIPIQRAIPLGLGPAGMSLPAGLGTAGMGLACHSGGASSGGPAKPKEESKSLIRQDDD